MKLSLPAITITLTLGTVIGLSQSAGAATFGQSWDKNCVGGVANSCSLQSLMNSVTVSGPTINTVTQQTGKQTFAAGSLSGTLLFNVAGLASQTKFGFYNINTGAKTTLLTGANPGATFTANSSSPFGFFIQTPNQTFYTQNLWNLGGKQQAVVYQGNGQTQFKLPKQSGLTTFTDNFYLIGFEDLSLTGNTDVDYNDLVVLVKTQPSSVPEPSVLVSLGLLGGAMGLMRRRKVAAPSRS